MKMFCLILLLVSAAAFAPAQEAPAGPSEMETSAVREAPETEIPALQAPETEAPALAAPALEMVKTESQTIAAVSNGLNRVSLLLDAGLKYANDGEYEEAEKAYLRALESDPGNDTVQFQLGTLYLQMGDEGKAASILEAMARKFPDNPVLLNNLAWLYATGTTMKNSELALRYAREALLLQPYAPSVWNTLAEAHYISGQYEQALRASEFAWDLLQTQKPDDEQRKEFQAQYQKIQRALESYKMLQKLDQPDS